MTGADKIICQAATLLVLFALTVPRHRALFAMPEPYIAALVLRLYNLALWRASSIESGLLEYSYYVYYRSQATRARVSY